MIRISPDVEAALAAGLPLVALETTIVTHGMPYPQNVSTALAVEAIVRDAGAIPATIALIGGRIHVGLSPTELEWLATAGDVLKLSRADLPYAMATGRHGATTVAATMMCAHLAGIVVFATGGIGGVHRGAETTMDISADLSELARTPVTVVCAGAKALLDLPKTLEVLARRSGRVLPDGRIPRVLEPIERPAGAIAARRARSDRTADRRPARTRPRRRRRRRQSDPIG